MSETNRKQTVHLMCDIQRFTPAAKEVYINYGRGRGSNNDIASY